MPIQQFSLWPARKDSHRHGRACAGHLRTTVEAQMAGTRPAMTVGDVAASK
jgi:hypothetical protein